MGKNYNERLSFTEIYPLCNFLDNCSYNYMLDFCKLFYSKHLKNPDLWQAMYRYNEI